MSDNKKKSKTARPTKTRSITEILFALYSFLFFSVGLSLIFSTEEVALITFDGDTGKVTNIFLQFFGSFELLASFLIFSLRKLKGRVIYYSLAGLIIVGFINLYLLFSLNEYIILPSIYFIFQIIIQLSFFIVLSDQVKRK